MKIVLTIMAAVFVTISAHAQGMSQGNPGSLLRWAHSCAEATARRTPNYYQLDRNFHSVDKINFDSKREEDATRRALSIAAKNRVALYAAIISGEISDDAILLDVGRRATSDDEDELDDRRMMSHGFFNYLRGQKAVHNIRPEISDMFLESDDAQIVEGFLAFNRTKRFDHMLIHSYIERPRQLRDIAHYEARVTSV